MQGSCGRLLSSVLEAGGTPAELAGAAGEVLPGGSGVCWRARHNYDVTKHLHVWVVRPGERVADMHPFSYGLHERRTAHRHAVTLDRHAAAHVWSCSDVACLLDSQRIQALEGKAARRHRRRHRAARPAAASRPHPQVRAAQLAHQGPHILANTRRREVNENRGCFMCSIR